MCPERFIWVKSTTFLNPIVKYNINRVRSSLWITFIFKIRKELPLLGTLYISTDTAILRQIGARLKSHRLHKSLTQEKLAEIAGFTRSYYTEIETGKRNISILNLYKLSQALDVSLRDVVNID